ncbi:MULTISPECIES: DUF72 domain-containing protein [Alphaproteobacteria]|uniref:DUF72 domain-containing protein n=2 Tax=Alphaproteobacteria TaxID=28211 RepID=A0A512HD83_9HYPH|nr:MULTISPECIES: DUF72 domain-containing protein [Alphaproteobacteria]GEO83330.1 hypothetical protein RNA01_02620 [Ciceribacter naphthalenivorans]GLR20276.1 hypothetical protein GCM10007920_00600 [Ciceribacter naphthalenivorans]GLT03132.1 hypothetical protein GCM10007926_00600 [Sphingomonas psychrolutea]
MTQSGTIRTGIGGWTFDPWEGTFYPETLTKKRQLEFASRALTAIEVNGTYYSSQKPATFAKWAEETPECFVFSLKASRYCTNRKVLAEAGPSIEKFLTQGIAELGDKLGPILWQFMATKKFEPEDFRAFLALLPKELDGRPLRHVVEPRHGSFLVPEFIDMLAEHGVAAVCADHHDYPMFADVTADFVYARLQKGADDIPTCYPPQQIDVWGKRLKTYAKGKVPDDLAIIDGVRSVEDRPRDVFAFFITGGKVNAPNGARMLQQAVA